ncbi:uncharacterized protein LOC115832160 [Nomascus leucogenys]|uniref:uncharacterized protein LOC115832160 n=1 Tax=Nomascus leucogenys TaxID=61853 RepID=UPI00122D5150|nr:uncharacterized protein LOC115832160 [Nomascus leucogenys]
MFQDGQTGTALVYSSQHDQCRRKVISAFPTEVLGSSHWDWLDSGCSPQRIILDTWIMSIYGADFGHVALFYVMVSRLNL